jgi:hypothetical protein
MKEEEDYLDLEYDDGCYSTTWGMLNMWYRRAQKLRTLKEKELIKEWTKKSQ